ncbi:hypothetical protein [Actinomyces sp. MRS3W]|uniref:hypothetical protein n=1 Tax=Actinomyces sp. MRS3W TaxID=2800796 RepID=UPI0028FD028C|nr:hypothetical protein [Actinomyces sp. MRS3W]MDU0348102.1 hypothetical protein [Actinomyces sp. MRS3W]
MSHAYEIGHVPGRCSRRALLRVVLTAPLAEGLARAGEFFQGIGDIDLEGIDHLLHPGLALNEVFGTVPSPG